MELPRAFRGIWIPKEIWFSDELTMSEKVIFAEIDSLDAKNGCWAKNSHFSNITRLSEKQVSRIITKLKREGYIDVVQENIKGVTRRTLKSAYAWMSRRSGGHLETETTAPMRSGDRTHAVSSIYDNTVDNTENTLATETVASGSHDIVDVIDAFKPVNPSYEKWFGNKTQRASVERLLKVHGKERLLKVIEFLPKSNTIPFVATITSPYMLEEKWADLQANLTKIKNKSISNKPNVII